MLDEGNALAGGRQPAEVRGRSAVEPDATRDLAALDDEAFDGVAEAGDLGGVALQEVLERGQAQGAVVVDDRVVRERPQVGEATARGGNFPPRAVTSTPYRMHNSEHAVADDHPVCDGGVPGGTFAGR
ncbi:hypothetical protein SAMN05421837_10164 [Amycolatopsis pretoriensis]|uniref:Uncharacterized protein n=1 Tax=Amycolatopsis pretoriensis TaxID=218821 RepID=A0A1H5Q105_9PSEU|nr:hypothetical protein SAMN05421837_10164 [Amycolatopsis pretoriensis]